MPRLIQPGVRIHHPSLRNCALLIPHPGDPRRTSQRPDGRRPKDYVIRLDAEGQTIVSETVWRRLQEARKSGLSPHEFIVLNEVANPPTQFVGSLSPARVLPTLRQLPDGRIIEDGAVQTTQGKNVQQVAQEFAPKGFKARLSRLFISQPGKDIHYG